MSPTSCERRAAAAALALWGASRALYHSAGLRLDDRDLGRFWHFVDPALLRADLWGSLWDLHGQPPLFNLFLGLVLSTGLPPTPLFAAASQAAGAALTASVAALAVRLGAPWWLAGLAAGLWAAHPTCALYESLLFYTWPVAAGLGVASWLLSRAAGGGRWWPLFGACAAIALTRSLFHLSWLIGAAVLCAGWAWRAGVGGRRVLAAAALPLALVVALYGKNAVRFGTFSASSWQGMSMARVTVDRLPRPLRKEWVADGYLSPLSGVGPFQPLDRYKEAAPHPARRGRPLLDRPLKESGAVNFNHAAYLAISRRFAGDAIAVVLREPGVYAISVRQNLRRTLAPASDWHPLDPNKALISVLAGASERADLARWLAPGAALLALLALVGELRRGRGGSPRALALAWVLYNTGWVVVVGALLERGENNRFRMLVDPLLVAASAGAVGAYCARFQARWRQGFRK